VSLVLVVVKGRFYFGELVNDPAGCDEEACAVFLFYLSPLSVLGANLEALMEILHLHYDLCSCMQV